MDKQAIIEAAYKLGFAGEHDVRGCAQCALAAVQDALKIRNDFVYKSASGLAGGGGERIDGLCGGYSGGIIAMSMFFGRTRPEEATKKGRADKYMSFRMASDLHDKFIEKYGTVLCCEIHKKIFGRAFDLHDDEQKQMFRDAGAHELPDKCCDVIGNGARWATELILAEMEDQGLTLEDFQYLIHPKE